VIQNIAQIVFSLQYEFFKYLMAYMLSYGVTKFVSQNLLLPNFDHLVSGEDNVIQNHVRI
jgi:hypothetical protein